MMWVVQENIQNEDRYEASTGGLKLAEKMQKYCSEDWSITRDGSPLLIVDDVFRLVDR